MLYTFKMTDELLDLVDDNDNVIKQIKRSESKGVRNVRVINIFITTKDNKLIVPLRSHDRRIFPNCYDFSVGGYVEAGDSYEYTAHKELQEELGIDGELKEIWYYKPGPDPRPISFMKLYTMQYDGDVDTLDYDKQGIQKLYTYTKDEILKMLDETPEKFKGDFKESFLYFAKYWT